MAPVTPRMINSRREENCIAVTAERKYYRVGHTFVKRSLRPAEWQTNPRTGVLYIPRLGHERTLNEAACMKFIAEHTNVPVLKLYCSFEDDEAVYLVMEYVEGARMDSLDEHGRSIVREELDKHIETLRTLRSNTFGGPSGLVVPPYRVIRESAREHWDLQPLETEDLVFCHNDLSMENTIVDPETLKVRAILDWEYAGFYPEYFERKFYERQGPSIALEGEEDDSQKLLSYLQAHQAA